MRKEKNILKYINFVLVLAILFGTSAPAVFAASTSSKYQVSGWIPYWTSVAGAKDAQSHLNVLDTVHPFGYSVRADGTLNDLSKLSKAGPESDAKTAWQSLFTAARKKKVKVVPSIMWSSGGDIDRILSDKTTRTKHIKAISSMVKNEKVDGVNIDYEAKLSLTKDSYSLFLKELKKELGKNKILSCAVEARTPPDSLYRVVPANIQYANDFKAIGKYCDEIQLMAYDQGRADFKLNGEKSGAPYIPVADKDWVRKVAVLASKEIPKKKLMLGVPTYGREYIVTVSPNRFSDYNRIQSVNHPLATYVADIYDITPSRNKAGELNFSYLPDDGTALRRNFSAMLPSLAVPAGTSSGDMIAQKALAYANTTGQTVTFNYMTWSDSGAIKEKVELAQELGLKGVAMFKIDSEEDPAIWGIMK